VWEEDRDENCKDRWTDVPLSICTVRASSVFNGSKRFAALKLETLLSSTVNSTKLEDTNHIIHSFIMSSSSSFSRSSLSQQPSTNPTTNIPYGYVPAYLAGSASLVEELDAQLLIVLRDGRHLVGVSRSSSKTLWCIVIVFFRFTSQITLSLFRHSVRLINIPT
jgi:hypothetical protein